MSCKPYIFGTQPNNLTPQLTSCRGMNNFYTVPNGWFSQNAFAYDGKSPASEMVVSPNADFSPPVYYATLSDDNQTFCFQDVQVETIANFRPWRP